MVLILGPTKEPPGVVISWEEFVALRQFRSAVLVALSQPGHVTKTELRAIEAIYQKDRTHED